MKQPRFAVFCHAADALPNPQGLAASRRRKNRFRSAGITFLHPNTETSFRLSPPTAFFRSCRSGADGFLGDAHDAADAAVFQAHLVTSPPTYTRAF